MTLSFLLLRKAGSFARLKYIRGFGVALYFIATLASFVAAQSGSNIYAVANALQRMPILYVVAFVFFRTRHAILAGSTVFALSLVPSLGVLLFHGYGYRNLALGSLLINAYLVHLLTLLCLSLVPILHNQFVRATQYAHLMEEAAQTDQLTGIANRRGLEGVLEHQGKSSNQPVTLILLDLDHFKQVNDRFGHLLGGEVLFSTAQLIKRRLRASDTVGRWGGEEFLVVAANTSSIGGASRAERVRQLVGASVHPIAGAITVSAGVAEWVRGRHLSETLQLADQALYTAKLEGRNRVEVFGSAPPQPSGSQQPTLKVVK